MWRDEELKLRRLKRNTARGLLFIIALITAFAFIVPTLLTFTNSFMSQSELSAKYGVIFGSKGYMTEETRLKFIPDIATFKQYGTVLFKSPDYLMKFWNSMILTVPIVAFQLILALLAAYSFTRFSGQIKGAYFLCIYMC
jgi:multiple sugar transport system permease protein